MEEQRQKSSPGREERESIRLYVPGWSNPRVVVLGLSLIHICRAGILIGKGETPEQAMKEVGAVVEGYYATASAMELAKKVGVEMPITEATYAVLYKGVSVQQMQRSCLLYTSATVMPHRACKACGTYNGRTVIAVKAE